MAAPRPRGCGPRVEAGRTLIVRDLGANTEYGEVMAAMRAFTDARAPESADELWLTEHRPVFTLGQAGRREFLLAPGDIPVVQSDRGGQITYHGPGQLVVYLLLDLRRLGLAVRELVGGIERALIGVLGGYGVVGRTRPGAPGVFVGGDKIAALGLRVRRRCTYHGASLNVDVDLAPYRGITACGLDGVGATTLRTLTRCGGVPEVAPKVVAALAREFGFLPSRRAVDQASRQCSR